VVKIVEFVSDGYPRLVRSAYLFTGRGGAVSSQQAKALERMRTSMADSQPGRARS
jgi:hypothetical protein